MMFMTNGWKFQFLPLTTKIWAFFFTAIHGLACVVRASKGKEGIRAREDGDFPFPFRETAACSIPLALCWGLVEGGGGGYELG